MEYCGNLACFRQPCYEHVALLSDRLVHFQENLVGNSELREQTFKLARNASRELEVALYRLHQMKSLDYSIFLSHLLTIVKQSVPSSSVSLQDGDEEDSTEEGSWGVLQRFVQVAAFAYFRSAQAATCISLRELQSLLAESCPSVVLTDEVYLGGIMSFLENVSQYAVQQRSLLVAAQCKETCTELWREFQLFDFRNGWLRRRLDGIKYRVRELEDLCFALANKEGNAPSIQAKIPVEDLAAIRERMRLFDLKREEVIKACRPLQKNSKNAIYRLLNGRMQEADELLKSVQVGASQLYSSIIASHPILRMGSFANALEEYAEGYLLQQWLLTGSIEGPDVFHDPPLEPAEYLGGLGDFTGEVGRWGTNAAARGDGQALEKALNAVLEVEGIMLNLTLPRGLGSKRKLVTSTARKLERQSLELLLSGRASGASEEQSSE